MLHLCSRPTSCLLSRAGVASCFAFGQDLSRSISGGASNGQLQPQPPLDRGQGDQVQLHGLQFFGRHGVFQEEQVLGQRFVVNATLWMDLKPAGASDKLADTINYAEVYSTVKGIIEGPPYQLLEAAAEAVSSALLSSDSRLSAVQVQLLKPHVAVPGVVDALGVQIYRSRQQQRPG